MAEMNTNDDTAPCVSSEQLFPMCEYPEMCGDVSVHDKISHACTIELAKLSRSLLSVTLNTQRVEELYNKISECLVTMDRPPLAPWGVNHVEFFTNLHAFLTIPFTVKECDSKECTQRDVTTDLLHVLSDSGIHHIHAGCPFHIEDNLTHCVHAMLRAIGIHIDESFDAMFRKGVTALLHDIAKGCTLLISGKNVAFPAHGIGGSITCRHIWNTGFLRWFTSDQWDHLCDVICFHMYGCSRDPAQVNVDAISRLPSDLRSSLCELSRADRGGGIPLEAFAHTVPFLGEGMSGKQMLDEAAEITLDGFMETYSLRGVYISLVGGSAQGKSRTAEYIIERLTAKGVSPDRIHHFQRDEFILATGRKLLGNADATYIEAYAEVERVNAENRAAGKSGPTIKQQISSSMASAADLALRKGHIVIYDTCATYYFGARHDIFPSAAADSLRLNIHVVRTTCVTEADQARHGMETLESQISAATSFSLLKPFSEGVGGKKGIGLRDIRPVWAAWDPVKEIHGKCPHFALSVSTAVRDGQELPNRMLTHFVDQVATIPEREYVDPVTVMNLGDLMNYLDTLLCGAGSSRAEMTSALEQWFNERAYSVSYPMRGYLRRAEYYAAILSGNSELADQLKVRIPDSLYVASPEDISRMNSTRVAKDVETLTVLNSSLITVKYRDGVNRQWTAPWHIQSRTPICMFTDKWSVVSAMPRGPEVAGDTEHEVVELQDLEVGDDDDLSHFAEHYQTIVRAMNGNEDEATKIDEVVCSSKRDGMCFRCIYIKKGTAAASFWSNVLKFVDDPFVSAFIQTSRRLTRGDIVIPASNGTAFLTQPNIQNWMACSIALSYGISNTTLLEISRNSGSAVDVMNVDDLLNRFITDIVRANSNSQADTVMHTFEAIGGPNRMCAFDTVAHTELASNYTIDQCGISYLGYSFSTTDGYMSWVPHYDVNHPFYEPTFWRFPSVRTTLIALKDLAKVFSGATSWEEFFSIHPHSNKDVEKAMLPDPEGFVAYPLMHAFGVKQPVYCKAKTWMYYILHKIKSKNIPSILGMPEKFGDAFPGYKAVKDFFGNLEGIEAMITELCGSVMLPTMVDSISEKAKGALQRVTPDVGFKLVLNNAKSVWPDVCIPIAAKYFDAFTTMIASETKDSEEETLDFMKKRSEGADTLRCLLMELKCYEPEWQKRLAEELDIDAVASSGKIPKTIGSLWDVIWSAH